MNLRIDSKNRSIVNIIGAPLIIFCILYSSLTFSALILLITIISFSEFLLIIRKQNLKLINRLLIIILGPLWIVSLTLFIRIYESTSPLFIVSIFIGVWVTDSMAFILGKKYGDKKLAPKISPNKTWYGAISGYISCFFFWLLVYYFSINILKVQFILNIPIIFKPILDISDILLLSVITGVFSQIGDLLESWFKRKFGVKDSGTLLLGHGGFLDRFDSFFIVGIGTYLWMICIRTI